VTLGNRPSRVTQRAAGVFIQDNFRVTSNLMLELGLRYDINFTPTEDQDRFVVFDPATVSLLRVGSGIGEVYPTSYNNIEPRVGLSWDPFKDGKTSIRAAYGRFTDQPVTNMITPLASNPPLATPLSITGAPGVVNLSNAVSAARAVGLAPNSVSRDFKNAHIQSWNVNVQREISSSLGVMIGYFGSKGSDLRLSRNLNQFVNGVRPFPRLSAASPILPGSGLGNITEISSLGVSKYNALWVSANKRMGKGLQFNASYTLSKSTDYNSLNSQGIVLQNSFDPANNLGPSDFDARHRFVINAIYELPFKGNGFVEGWQISTIAQFQSGNPLNVVVASNALTGIGNTVRPDLTGSINVVGQTDRWFDTTAFTVPNPLRFGNLERNAVVGPGFNNVDLSIIKNVSLGGDRKLQIRAEAFDLFNHANLGQPGRIVGTPNFGRITSTRLATGDSGSSRQIQLAAKFIF
jgi:hypothetical protein